MRMMTLPQLTGILLGGELLDMQLDMHDVELGCVPCAEKAVLVPEMDPPTFRVSKRCPLIAPSRARLTSTTVQDSMATDLAFCTLEMDVRSVL